MRYANELKVGIVFLAGLLLIIFGYFFLRGLGVGGDFYYVKLDGAAQIAEGNEVRLQGVKVGQVKEVGFDPRDQKPLLTLVVRRDDPPIKLLRNYQYAVQNSGIIGENYVDIRGDYNASARVYNPNDESQIIPGRATSGLLSITEGAEDIVKDLRVTLGEFNKTLTNINNGVLNPKNQQELARTLSAVAKLSENASQAVGPEGVKFSFGDRQAQRNLNQTLSNVERASRSAATSASNIEGLSGDARRELGGLLRENRPQLRRLLNNFDRAAYNVAGVTETLDFALRQGGFKENSQIAFQSLRRAAENIEVATSGFRRIGEDPNTSGSVTGALRALRESSEALRDTAQSIRTLVYDDATKGSRLTGTLTNLNAAAENLAAGTAGLKGIIGDENFQADIKAAANNLNATLAATRATTERINGLLGGRRPSTRPANGETSSNETAQGSSYRTDGLSFVYRRHLDKVRGESGPNHGDVEFNSEFFGAPFRAGLSSIGDGNDLTLQTGRFIGDDIALRYGLYRSELGAGVELRKGRLSLEGNLWGLNDSSYNVYGGYNVTPNLQIMAGRESINGDSTNSIAVRVRP